MTTKTILTLLIVKIVLIAGLLWYNLPTCTDTPDRMYTGLVTQSQCLYTDLATGEYYLENGE